MMTALCVACALVILYVLPAIEQLESALSSYPGTLLLVTHDRRMLDAVTTNRRLRVAAGRIAED